MTALLKSLRPQTIVALASLALAILASPARADIIATVEAPGDIKGTLPLVVMEIDTATGRTLPLPAAVNIPTADQFHPASARTGGS